MVHPLRELIDRTYDLFLFRPPTREETMDHIALGRGGCGDDQETVRRLRAGSILPYLNIRPLNVEMDITTVCNIRCTMCLFQNPSISSRKRADMPIESFERIASQVFSCVNRLCLSFSTEPLLNNDFPDMVSLAMKYRIPNIHLSTNGMLLTERISEILVTSGFHAMNISLDAGGEETFERLRKGASFKKVLGNVEAFNRIKEKHGALLPRLCCSFVMMRSNIRELPAFIDLAHRLKASDVHLMHMVPFSEEMGEKESLVHERDLCNRMLAQARVGAAALKMTLFEPGDFPMHEEPSLKAKVSGHLDMDSAVKRIGLNLGREDHERNCCPFPWHFMAIGPEGEVLPCGWWSSMRAMGNIHTQDFEEIWKGDRFEALRRHLAQGHALESCRICPSAGMGDITSSDSFATRKPA